jgi:hypothetical protein
MLREQAEQHLVHEVGYAVRVIFIRFISKPLRQIGELPGRLLGQRLSGNIRP